MKKNDVAIIILVVSIVLVASYLIGGALINSPESRSTEIEIAIPFGAEFDEPSAKVFNDNSINPTEIIRIGEDNKDKPFEDTN